MYSRRKLLVCGTQAGAAILAARSLPGQVQGAVSSVLSATAITQVFGEGQKLTAIALEYPEAVASETLTPAAFRVEGRTIVRVYASATPDIGSAARSGRYLILELSPNDKDALLIGSPVGGGARPQGGMAGSAVPGGSGPSGPGSGAPGGPPAGQPRSFPAPVLKPAQASVVQLQDIAGKNHAVYKASASPIITTHVKNLVVDDFKQLTYKAGDADAFLAYNLFTPRRYDRSKRYPLVLFIHDAGTLSRNPMVTLEQGLGAVIWATPEDQAKRECFVVAPQFSSVAQGETSGPGSPTALIAGLLRDLARQYSIDTGRLYATGQSMGCTLCIGLNIAHPELFAASFLVAGQWDAEQARPLAKDKLWIVVSEGDQRAYPGENAMSALWEKDGAQVTRAVWDGRATPAEFAADVKAVEAKRTPINYVALRKGTVVPPTQPDNGATNHINTWRIAYNIEGIRAWLFEQHR